MYNYVDLASIYRILPPIRPDPDLYTLDPARSRSDPDPPNSRDIRLDLDLDSVHPYMCYSRVVVVAAAAVKVEEDDEAATEATALTQWMLLMFTLQVKWKTVPVSVPEPRVNPKFPALDYEYVLMEPISAEHRRPPLVVFIHGGPHSSFLADFQPYTAGFCMCGYAVLMVNYRGSIGFGQDSINSLLGNIGRQDVDDVQDVVEQIVASGAVDNNKVVVIGGSHGGFLTLHAIGQFPNFYRAAVTRNPVVNLASKFGCSDIPDWTCTEAGIDFDPMVVPTSEMYGEMLKRSPLVNVDKIKTPLMLMLGGKDIRVPTSQGLEMKKALEARNAPLRVLWYPECSHPISDVKSEADSFINIIKWFDEHLMSRP